MNYSRAVLGVLCAGAFMLTGPAWANDNNSDNNNDFPTLARVEYVLGCMQERGGENYDNLYRCVCLIDTLAEHFTYEEYNEASTYAMLRSTAGERGSVFRDPPQSGSLRQKLEQVNAAAQKKCLTN